MNLFYESFKNKNHSRISPKLFLNGKMFWCKSNYLRSMEKDVSEDFPYERIITMRYGKK